MSTPSIIICASHSFKDPLFNGLMYQYILAHQSQHAGQCRYHIVTEEQEAFRMNAEQKAELQNTLNAKNIFWHPMPYRGGRFILFKKLWNFLGLFFKLWSIKRREKTKLIIGFLAIAGGYAFIISRILGMRLMVFCFEPHSLYMKEFGIWPASSLKFKLLNKVERWQATKADFVSGPTIHTINLLKSWQSKAQLFRVPISIDTQKFSFSEAQRQAIRQQFNIPDDRYLMLYLGKFGGIYYDEKEVATFCKRLYDFDNSIFFFTITPNATEDVNTAYKEAGLKETDFKILNKIPYSEIEAYISACDLGIVAIPPLDSQKFRTPVKIGNYLGCGIPFIVNRGIADDDIMAEEENVGVVFESLDQKEMQRPLQKLKSLMQEDKEILRNRCRKAAIKHRGLQNSTEVLKYVIEQCYLSNKN